MKTTRTAMVVMVAGLALSRVSMFASDRGMMDAQGELTYENPFGWTHATAGLLVDAIRYSTYL